MTERTIVIVEPQTLAGLALKELAQALDAEFDVQVLSQEPVEETLRADLLIYGFKSSGQLLLGDLDRVAAKFRFLPKLFVVDEVSIEAMKLANQANFQLLARSSSCFHILDAIQASLRLGANFLGVLTPDVASGQSPIKYPTSIKPLTVRHVQVLELLSKGLSSKQIAGILGLSQDTIAAHLREAFLRLKAKSRSEAMTNYLSAKRLAEKLFPAALERVLDRLNQEVEIDRWR